MITTKGIILLAILAIAILATVYVIPVDAKVYCKIWFKKRLYAYGVTIQDWLNFDRLKKVHFWWTDKDGIHMTLLTPRQVCYCLEAWSKYLAPSFPRPDC